MSAAQVAARDIMVSAIAEEQPARDPRTIVDELLGDLSEAGLEFSWAGERRVIDLTAREAQILGEVGRFGTHAEAARSLGLAPNTVEQHLVSVRRKLDVGSTSEALAVARRRGVVE